MRRAYVQGMRLPELNPPKTLDIGWRDLGFALSACVRPGSRGAARSAVHSLWSEDALTCASVRTGFDLWLCTQAFAPGSELVMSAVTLPDMVRVAESHGLVIVPVDIEVGTMAPGAADIEAAVTERTVAVVVAHLFGGRVNLASIAGVARRHGLFLVEDCAQAYAPGVRGDSLADVSMFSFGPIKTATALGGAVLEVKDPLVRRLMREEEATYPVAGKTWFARRVLKYMALKAATHPRVYGLLAMLLAFFGRDIAQVAKGASRGFGSGDLLGAIRVRPATAMLRLLARRLRHADDAVAQRAEVSAWLARKLEGSLEVPGARAMLPTYWLFPVVVANPDELCAALRARGFDAGRGSTSLAPIGDVATNPRAHDVMGHVVYVPVSPELSGRDLTRLLRLVVTHAGPRPTKSHEACEVAA